MIDLRSFVFLDSLQPQHAAFLGTVAKGFLPTAHQASLFIEVAPGITINKLTDIADLAVGNNGASLFVTDRAQGIWEVGANGTGGTITKPTGIVQFGALGVLRTGLQFIAQTPP